MFLVKAKNTASGFQHVELETINGLWFGYAYILSAWVGGIEREVIEGTIIAAEISLELECC
jgi:hypothetical protein